MKFKFHDINLITFEKIWNSSFLDEQVDSWERSLKETEENIWKPVWEKAKNLWKEVYLEGIPIGSYVSAVFI